MLNLIMSKVIANTFYYYSTLFLSTLYALTHVMITTNLATGYFIRKLRHKEGQELVQS